MRKSLIIANGIVIASALLWLLSLMIAFIQPFRAVPRTDVAERRADPTARSAIQRGWFGFVLRLDGQSDPQRFTQAIDEIAAMNANCVLLETPVSQAGAESDELSTATEQCPSTSDLLEVIHHARSRNLAVLLVPVIVFQDDDAHRSRSRFAPADWDRWWLSYERYILQLADLAQASGVELLSVGSELSESEVMTNQWISLLNQVRTRYSGLLMYNAQWDRVARVGFWPHVDLIGVSAWFPIDPDQGEIPSTLEVAWETALREIDLLAARADRPLLLTAVGYPSRATALTQPWQATDLSEAVGDEEIQFAALQAFLTQFEIAHRQSMNLAGFCIYRWDLDSDPAAQAVSHGIEGKSAQPVVRESLRRLTTPDQP